MERSLQVMHVPKSPTFRVRGHVPKKWGARGVLKANLPQNTLKTRRWNDAPKNNPNTNHRAVKTQLR
jgi:hypothetical protein